MSEECIWCKIYQRERDEARKWAVRFRELLGYAPEEWHQHIARFKVDWDEYQAAVVTAQWPDWLKSEFDSSHLDALAEDAEKERGA